MKIPGFADVQAAAGRLKDVVKRTPVDTSQELDAAADAALFFKCENLQRVGAFKYRGASNAVMLLGPQAERGVAAHSSGNHAQALSLAARVREVPAHIVMPKNAPRVKVDGVRDYGGKIVFCESTLEARESTLEKVIEETGAVVVHPYDNEHIIAGQGTAALELLEDAGPLDAIIAPVGGGGLLAGTAIAAHGVDKRIQIYGAEPVLADDAHWSLKTGSLQPPRPPETIADGLRTALSERTFKVLQGENVEVLLVSEDEIMEAVAALWEKMRLVVEPSGATTLAAVLRHPEIFNNKRVGIILSGGNVDLDRPELSSIFG